MKASIQQQIASSRGLRAMFIESALVGIGSSIGIGSKGCIPLPSILVVTVRFALQLKPPATVVHFCSTTGSASLPSRLTSCIARYTGLGIPVHSRDAFCTRCILSRIRIVMSFMLGLENAHMPEHTPLNVRVPKACANSAGF